jgi:hypothetical protein
MIQYNESGNFDRIIAAELAVALTMKLDTLFGKIGDDSGSRTQSLGVKRQKSSLFPESKGVFNNKKRKLFR